MVHTPVIQGVDTSVGSPGDTAGSIPGRVPVAHILFQMRIRASIGILIGAFVAATIATAATPGGSGGIIAWTKLIALVTSVVSGVSLVVIGIKATRDRIMGRRQWDRALFPTGRCHACGYDTSGLVRGTVACPECGAILASIPKAVRES